MSLLRVGQTGGKHFHQIAKITKEKAGGWGRDGLIINHETAHWPRPEGG